MYKIELHLHTKYSSECGQMSAEDLIAGYKAAGYSGIVVTDHFNRDTFRMLAIDPASGIDRLTPFLEGYRRMKEAGERQGIKIYRGAELRFDGCFNDYLFYNYPDSLLEDPEKLFTMGLPAFYELHKGTGSLLIQAHPNRTGCTPADPQYLDGVEILNTHPFHNNQNELTQQLAAVHPHLIRTGGSDCHKPEHLGRGGIVTDELPEDDAALVTLLRRGKYSILKPDQV